MRTNICSFVSNFNWALKNKLVFQKFKYNSIILLILNILWKSRLIIGYTVKSNKIIVFYKYTGNNLRILDCLQLISKPSIKYFFKKSIRNKKFIFSTSKGLFINNFSEFSGGIAIVEIKV